jgi:hypothetical protein
VLLLKKNLGQHSNYYDYYGSPPAWYETNTERAAPSPRAGAASGMGIGSQRYLDLAETRTTRGARWIYGGSA